MSDFCITRTEFTFSPRLTSLTEDTHIITYSFKGQLCRLNSKCGHDCACDGRNYLSIWPIGVILAKRYDVPDNCKFLHKTLTACLRRCRHSAISTGVRVLRHCQHRKGGPLSVFTPRHLYSTRGPSGPHSRRVSRSYKVSSSGGESGAKDCESTSLYKV
jgi:hypothetical protein